MLLNANFFLKREIKNAQVKNSAAETWVATLMVLSDNTINHDVTGLKIYPRGPELIWHSDKLT